MKQSIMSADREISSNRMLAINLVSNLVAFGANLIINFFLSPYIVKVLGVEANGFVNLANNFVAYAAIVVLALNSMSGRFITIAVHKGDMEEANKYYTAVMLGNFFLSAAFTIPSIYIVWRLERLIDIPPGLVSDVKMLFALIIIRFLFANAFSGWGTAIFVKNKLFIQSIWNMLVQSLRVVIVIGLFYFFQPSIYYVGVSFLTISMMSVTFSRIWHIKLLPDMKIRWKDFGWGPLRTLLGAGVWNTILRSGQMLLSGMDILVANILLGANAMGIIALSRTVPNLLYQLSGTITYVFVPTLTIEYAKGNMDKLKSELKKGMKMTSVLLTIPLAILFVYGYEFYHLWVPSEDAGLLQVLSIISIFGLVFTSGIQSLYSVFTVVNKLKIQSILVLASGLISLGMVFVLVKTTTLGIYAVAGVSTVISLFRDMIYTIPFSSKYLKFKWYTFFPEVAVSVVSVTVSIILGLFLKQYLVVDTWFMFFFSAGIMGVITLISNMFIVLSGQERRYFVAMIAKKLGRSNKGDKKVTA